MAADRARSILWDTPLLATLKRVADVAAEGVPWWRQARVERLVARKLARQG